MRVEVAQDTEGWGCSSGCVDAPGITGKRNIRRVDKRPITLLHLEIVEEAAKALSSLPAVRRISHAWAMRYAWSSKGGWRLSCSPVMRMTVTEERLKQRGYQSFKDY